jgi:N-acetylmuramoyl-L-alanine amidase CwlA
VLQSKNSAVEIKWLQYAINTRAFSGCGGKQAVVPKAMQKYVWGSIIEL